MAAEERQGEENCFEEPRVGGGEMQKKIQGQKAAVIGYRGIEIPAFVACKQAHIGHSPGE